MIYGSRISAELGDPGIRSEVEAKLARALLDGPGIVVFKQAFSASAVDPATEAFQALIRPSGPPASSRVTISPSPAPTTGSGVRWTSWRCTIPKSSSTTTPTTYPNLVSTRRLGPQYQVTSQLNVVNPGGQAQVAHRDYHLGFMSADQSGRYPVHIHLPHGSPHPAGCGRPLRHAGGTGPTLYLPHSQKYGPGYLASTTDEFTGVLRRTLRAASSGQGRRRVLQPRAVPRRGHQPTADVRGWLTCCRCPRRSAEPWRPSIGRR